MNRLLLLAVAALLSLPLAAAQAAPSGNLYLQDVDGGVLRGSKLILRGVSERTVQFSDRPQRRGGTISTRRFVREWKSEFRGDPPNAALEVANAPRGRDVALLELLNPRYDARSDTLVYSVRHLKALDGQRLPGLERRGDHRRVIGFDQATLFIDPGVASSSIGIFVHVPAGQELTLEVNNSEFDYSRALLVSGIRTTPVDNRGNFEVSTGLIALRGNTMLFEATAGGGGLSAQLITFVDVPASKELTGTAKVPSGGSLQIGVTGGQSKTIRSGPFTMPIQEED